MEWKDREKQYACWLCNFPEIGNGQLHRLTELCGGPEAVYLADKKTWGEVLSPKQVQGLSEYTACWKPEAEYRRMQAEGIVLLTVTDREYPERLREIPDTPYYLFVKGRLPSEDTPAVAIVGARECSAYGRYVAGQLGASLGRRGVTVVSGMARGIDGISQEAALEAGGCSVGVLGSGVDICHPAQNRALYENLIQSGAVVSICPVGTPARPQNFPPRNRIVSGLADVVVVVEARVKSGTLITVDMALEQGREVYVVPGRVTDRLSDGCNRLIRQGAGMLLSPELFLEEVWKIWERRRRGGETETARRRRDTGRLKLVEGGKDLPRPEDVGPAGRIRDIRRGKKREPENTFLERPELERLPGELAKLYEALDFDAKTPAELAFELGGRCPEKEVVMRLMELCMAGLAVQVSPGRFCCRRE